MIPDLLRPPRIFILLFLITFASVSGVLFTPALPNLAVDFGISDSTAQLAVSIFLIGYSIGQLPYGPIANRFGRKNAIYGGVSIAFIGSLLCLFAPTFSILCIGRFIQALGAAVGLKVSFTMIGDLHAGPSAAKAISLVSLAFGVMPGLGAAIGGFLTLYFGWQGCFVFLAFYSIILGFLCRLLPETAKHLDNEALQLQKIAHGYARQFKNPFLILNAVLMGLPGAVIYIFATAGPYVGIETIGLSPDRYGLWCILPSFGLATGLFLSNRVAGKIHLRSLIFIGILILLAAAAVMTAFFAGGLINPYSLFFLMYIINIGGSIVFTFTSSTGLSEATDKSNATAVLQFINMSIATSGTFLITLFPAGRAIVLPLAFFALGFLMLGIWALLRKHHLKDVKKISQ